MADTAFRRPRRRFATAVVLVLALPAGVFAAWSAGSASAADVTISPVPLAPLYSASTTYALTVNGAPVPVVEYSGYDYAAFSMGDGAAKIAVTKLNKTDVGAAYISPQKLGLTATRIKNTATFILPHPEYLIVKLDGRKQLVIAADPPETDRPVFQGEGVFPITRADPTGQAPSTQAIQSALDQASGYGSTEGHQRGVVYIPHGVYSIANLDIGSHTSVYLESGAVLRAIPDKSLYTMDGRKNSQNRDVTWWIQTKAGADDVKLYGRGTLDGNGMATRKADFGLHILAVLGSSNVTVDGLTMRESSTWSVIPVRSNDLRFTNLKLFNRLDMGENDGIDVIESQNVLVQRGIGIALDDPYSTKSYPTGMGELGRNWPKPAEKVENVTFDGLLSWTICYGFKVGQGVSGDHTNVTFRNGVVYDAAVGLGIHHKAYAGTVHGVTFDNIDIEKLSYSNDGNRTWLAFMIDDTTHDGAGPVEAVTVSHVNVRDRGTTPAKLTGLSDHAGIHGVTLDQIRMPGSSAPATTLAELNLTQSRFATDVRFARSD